MYKWYYDPCSCKSARELLDMLKALETEIKSIEERISLIGTVNRKLQLGATTHVKFQYIIYMNLYGPPEDGVWDEALLEEIYEKYKDG